MKKLTGKQVQQSLSKVKGWKIEGDAIGKTFKFEDYYETIAFVNAIAWIANQSNHHPDLEVGYNRCVVRYSTHDAGGLTTMDFQAAKAVDALGKPAD